jgi:RNA polymerase sigma-70 factor (ECF subfamily)
MGLGEEQFTTLITRWGGFLRHYLWDLCGEKDLAEDLLQNTWLRAWEHRAMVQEEGLARAWLFSIATNVFRDHWRRQAIGRRILGRPVTLSPELTWKAPPEPMDARLLHALAALALEDRQLALLVGVHGCTRREAADLLGISHDTARKRWQRARAKLEHVMTLTASPVRGGASRRDGAKPEEAST